MQRFMCCFQQSLAALSDPAVASVRDACPLTSSNHDTMWRMSSASLYDYTETLAYGPCQADTQADQAMQTTQSIRSLTRGGALFLSLLDLPCRASRSSRVTTPTPRHMLSSKQSCMQSRKHSAA